jgi:hypothetical protein
MMHPPINRAISILMNRNCLLRPSRGLPIRSLSNQGAALIIVLGFLVLLVGVVVAFFVKATNDRQIADSSASQTKVEILARGAIDTLIGDLKQEIADGSTAVTNVSGTVTNIIYFPYIYIGTVNTYTNVVPVLVGSSGTNGLQNLLKISTNAPFYTLIGPEGRVTGITRASADSTTNSSLNFRSISPARWNKPLLLPPTSTTDYTPVSSAGFTPPSWVYVNRAGSNPTTWSTSMRYSPTNSSAVIGRYAYAIYDEGGLLDINAAGFPSVLTNATGTWAASNYPSKISLSYADLTQLTDSDGTQLLTQAQIDQLVSWRNTASLVDTSSVRVTATNYANYALSRPSFLISGNTNLLINGSDHPFTSRQQLISYFSKQLGGSSSLSTLQSLQYLATFTRTLNQPSLWWPTNIPVIVSDIGTSGANYTDYGGGNSDYGKDFQVNTNFLSARVTANFTRNDDSVAQVGEPLVKKRFPLEYLAWITYQGPSAARDFTDPDMAALLRNPGVTTNLLALGTTKNIRNYFGLVWNKADNLWDYSPSGSAATPAVGALSLLSNLTGSREPNFIELLKATIKAGSLGKSNGGFAYSTDKLNYGLVHKDEASSDNHIFQIAANIIEQTKIDSYPVRIRFRPTNSQSIIFAGSENLPYLLRWRNIAVNVSQPLVTPATPISNPSFYTPDSTNASSFTYPVPLTLYPGYGVFLIVPEIWNPYDQNSSTGANGPTSIRIVADNNVTNTMNSADGSVALGGQANVSVNQAVGTSGGSPSFPTAGFQLNPNTSALINSTFVANQNLFREPMCIRTPGLGGWTIQNPASVMNGSFPADSNGKTSTLVTANGVVDWRDPSRNYIIGIFMGYYPQTKSYLHTNGTNYAIDGLSLGSHWSGPRHNQNSLTLRMQYLDINSVWRDYDTKKWINTMWNSAYPAYLRGTGNGPFSINMSWDDMVGSGGWAFAFDPRTMRFGINSAQLGQGEAPFYKFPNGVSITNLFVAASDFTNNVKIGFMVTNIAKSNNILGTSHYDLYGYQSTNKYGNTSFMNYMIYASGAGFNIKLNNVSANFADIMDAGFCINSSNRVMVYPTNGGWNSSAWYSDPDGVQRMGMGAYAAPSYTNSGTLTSNLGIPTITATTNWNSVSSQTPTAQSLSRPIILHRPFRSVAELGYVFRDIPWKNLDFFTPESGDNGLLDVFCIHDASDQDALMAGKVNLNTRQTPVLKAILSGSQTDELLKSGTTTYPFPNNAVQISSSEVANIATALVGRTATSPFSQLSDLVGQYLGGGVYTGFSADLSTCFTNPVFKCVQRFHEAPIRSLSNSGQTRVWNLLIDIVVQSGRYPTSAFSLNNFIMEGEKRFWVHIAIDRLTAKVIDFQIETVRE